MEKRYIKLLLLMVLFLYAVASDYEVEEKRGGKTLADVIKELAWLKQSCNSLTKRLYRAETRLMALGQVRNGKDGAPGPRGRPGPRGPRGWQGPRGWRGRTGRSGGGVKYIRWGKTWCPYGASVVYKGRIGGEHYTHPGGGANYVCLSESPRYLRYQPGRQKTAFMFGGEYDDSRRLFSNSRNLERHEAPCVACHVRTRSSKLMIPGTFKCPSGWTREYYGYLMTEYYGHKSNKQFICVDYRAQVVPGTYANLDGALLFFVSGHCGALPCLPYVHDRELTCAVCTK